MLLGWETGATRSMRALSPGIKVPATSATHRHTTVTTGDGLFPAGGKDVLFYRDD
jgi:hypothetical protein